MFYRRDNGVIGGGPFNCDQDFPVEFLKEDDPEVVQFMSLVKQQQSEPQPTIPDLVATIADLKSQLNANKIPVNGGIVKAEV